MQFYLKPVGGIPCLFTVLDASGQPVYEVTEKGNSLGGRSYLLDKDRNPVARILCVRLPDSVQYSVTAGKNRIRVIVGGTHKTVKIRGKHWHFRGNLLMRSFDILDNASNIVMTHGKCWSMAGNCYGIEISNSEYVSLCLCIAVIIDSTVTRSNTLPLPTGG